MVGLGDLSGGTFESLANGVSADGSVVVGQGASASGYEAFRWTSGGGMVGLGVLPVGGVDSAAFGVSADGSVVVGWGRSDNGGPGLVLEASRWTSGGGMVGVGDLPGGLFESFATDVSGDGAVVVGWGSAPGTEAFLWTSDGGMERLWDVLLAQGIDPAADGWTNLTVANGISANGNTIVGFGNRNGNTEAFVAVVPEPASLALTALGGIFLLRRCRRRRHGGNQHHPARRRVREPGPRRQRRRLDHRRYRLVRLWEGGIHLELHPRHAQLERSAHE